MSEGKEERDSGTWIMAGIMGAVAAFGIYLSIGVFRYSGRIAESWIVLGCTGGFLLFWGLLLLLRRPVMVTPKKPELPDEKLPPQE